MGGEKLASLRLEKYGRLFQKAAGAACPLFICDCQGLPLWSNNGSSASEAAGALTALTETGFRWEEIGQGVSQHRVDGHPTVLLSPLIPERDYHVGWLATVAGDGTGETSTLEALSETVEDIAACVGAEYRLTHELDGIAEELTDRYEELNLLYGMACHMRNYEQVDEFLTHLLDTCTEHLDIDLAAIVTSEEGEPRHSAGPGQPIKSLDLLLVQLRGSLYHFVAASRQPLVINDQDDPRRSYLLPALPYKVLAVPILTNERAWAILALVNRKHKRDFSNSDRALIELIADQASIVVHVHKMLGEMRKFTKRMAAALITAVEAKDTYTRGHSERVHMLSLKIGEAMGLNEDELEQLYWGSLLHDIGKIAVPDAILNKPSGLTEDEFTFIKMHPERSYEILRHIEYLRDGVLGARHHQERYDGTGYPHGLRGKDVPLLARIIAVADMFDAMTSSRSYRSSTQIEKALTEIRRVSGTQLDPDVVSVFLRLCEEQPEWSMQLCPKGEPGDG